MMMSRAAVVLIVYLIQGSLGHAVPQSPIVGIIEGHTVDIADVPYMACVLINYWACGGSIITEQFVLTAGHCVYGNQNSPEDYVRVGSSRSDHGGKTYGISRYIQHERYNAGIYGDEYDLGLLKLSTLLTFGSSVAPIILADSNLEIHPGMKAVISGWGRTREQPQVTTKELHQVSVSVASPSYCMSIDKQVISNKTICVTEVAGGTSSGDSGGPLVAEGRQIGIVSKGYGVHGFTPAYYINVAAFTKWIHDKLIDYA